MHRVSAAAHHQLLLQGEETVLQTRLPTVSTTPTRHLRCFLINLSALKKKKMEEGKQLKEDTMVVLVLGLGGPAAQGYSGSAKVLTGIIERFNLIHVRQHCMDAV